MSYYAIDFGTSNSLLNHISASGEITPIPLERDGTNILRSILFTSENDEWFFGKEAIAQYIENDGEGRLFRSLKKFLPEPGFKGTKVHNKQMDISHLIATFIREMRIRANKITGEAVTKVVLGRPAKYSLIKENDELAEARMKKAAELAGFEEVVFCPEPLAAGLNFDKDNTDEKLVLIADFGGGTSDFTLMKLHSGKYSQDDILGISGIFKAGDTLDGQMMLKIIAHHFGSEFDYKLPMGNNVLRFPKALLKKLGNPAYINHLKEKDTWEFLQKIKLHAYTEENKKGLDQLFALVEYQLGYQVFSEIEKAKITISNNSEEYYHFSYKYPEIDIKEKIEISNYNAKMLPVVDDIIKTMMDVFELSGRKPSEVSEICVTGGTGQFSLIQDELAKIFGKEKMIEHDVFESVVGGLSQYALNYL